MPGMMILIERKLQYEYHFGVDSFEVLRVNVGNSDLIWKAGRLENERLEV